MFDVDELRRVQSLPAFQRDFSDVRRALVQSRLGQPVFFDLEAVGRLADFIEAVLASAPTWRAGSDDGLCRTAAEIAELLSTVEGVGANEQRRLRLRCALLYDLAGLSSLSSAILRLGDRTGLLNDFFARSGPFAVLTDAPTRESLVALGDGRVAPFDLALSQDAYRVARFLQGEVVDLGELIYEKIGAIAASVSLDMSATECEALGAMLQRRLATATRAHVHDEATFDALRAIRFPAELWKAQIRAIREGLLDQNVDSWGFAAPTGTGKTFLTRLLILNCLISKPDSKILYIVPSKALVHEVATKLRAIFDPLGFGVISVTPQLVGLAEEEEIKTDQASVIVLTPEKADLLLRLGGEFFKAVSVIVVDEAHHIEAGTRGVLLELYLWRIKRLLHSEARLILLSAVAPNIRALTEWLGRNPAWVLDSERATRMRAGAYREAGKGRLRQAWIDYADGTSVCIVPEGAEKGVRAALTQLTAALSPAGPVLVVAKGKRECERLAELMLERIGSSARKVKDLPIPEPLQRLDSRLEREMYADVPMRALIRQGIAYHHAGLPPRVRTAVEDAIRAGCINFVFATTTLAEGVNFPFASVVVQSLAIREFPERGRPARYNPVTPRTFWNIAGRAGRPGYDREGQVILFTPSLSMKHVPYPLASYLDSELTGIAPVNSALALGIEDIYSEASAGRLDYQQLSNVTLPPELPKGIRGTVNLLRVGLIHGKASGILTSPEDILEGTFAKTLLDAGARAFGATLLQTQSAVIDRYFDSEGAPSHALVAELGLSLETVSDLQNYVQSLDDWQITAFDNVLRGGSVNNSALQWVVRAITPRMAELEGKKLGGLFSDIIVHWFSGVPFTVIRASSTQLPLSIKRLEDLIAVVYSQIQYLLPWGLYALDRFVETEARRRNLSYANSLQSLAYLSDAGVPNFHALRLTMVDIERVDATRLAREYVRRGGLNLGVDVVQWLRTEDRLILRRTISGRDNRRIDFDFEKVLSHLPTAS